MRDWQQPIMNAGPCACRQTSSMIRHKPQVSTCRSARSTHEHAYTGMGGRIRRLSAYKTDSALEPVHAAMQKQKDGAIAGQCTWPMRWGSDAIAREPQRLGYVAGRVYVDLKRYAQKCNPQLDGVDSDTGQDHPQTRAKFHLRMVASANNAVPQESPRQPPPVGQTSSCSSNNLHPTGYTQSIISEVNLNTLKRSTHATETPVTGTAVNRSSIKRTRTMFTGAGGSS